MDEIRDDVVADLDITDECGSDDECELEVVNDETVPETEDASETAVVHDESPEDETVVTPPIVIVKPRPRLFSAFRRGVCFVLCITGVSSYGYLGFCGLDLNEDRFRQIVASSVFGGLVDSVMPFPEKEDAQKVPENNSEPSVKDDIPQGGVPISAENIGCTDPMTFYNETNYLPDTSSVPASSVIPKFDESSAVLIIHTHGTESYSEDGKSADINEDFRTDDPENNMIAVGTAFAEILEGCGIEVIHCTEMFDEESYIDAYTRSAEAVKEYMEEYPQIKYVIDIHRDAVVREDGTVIRSDGGSGAQLMIVCGTDEMGADFPEWRENLAFGKEYQRMLFDKEPQLVRRMNLRKASFNQQLCERYLLLEVGTCGNTLDEAISSAEVAADVFADLIAGNK